MSVQQNKFEEDLCSFLNCKTNKKADFFTVFFFNPCATFVFDLKVDSLAII